MSPAKPKAPTLTHRVGALETRMARAEARLEALADLPSQVDELKTLLRSTLTSQQQRLDELEAHIIDAIREHRCKTPAIEGQEG